MGDWSASFTSVMITLTVVTFLKVKCDTEVISHSGGLTTRGVREPPLSIAVRELGRQSPTALGTKACRIFLSVACLNSVCKQQQKRKKKKKKSLLKSTLKSCFYQWYACKIPEHVCEDFNCMGACMQVIL